MSYRRRTIRLLLCVTLIAVPAVSFVAFLFTPFAVYTFGVELRPPWQDKAAWHPSRMDWFVQEAGYEHIIRELDYAAGRGPFALQDNFIEVGSTFSADGRNVPWPACLAGTRVL